MRLGPRRYHQGRDPEPLTILVYLRWRDVVVEAPVIVPGEHNRCRRPVLALHHEVDQVGDVVHPTVAPRRRVLAHVDLGTGSRIARGLPGPRNNPSYRGQSPSAHIGHKVLRILHVGRELSRVLLEVVEERQDVPDGWLQRVRVAGVPLPSHARSRELLRERRPGEVHAVERIARGRVVDDPPVQRPVVAHVRRAISPRGDVEVVREAGAH